MRRLTTLMLACCALGLGYGGAALAGSKNFSAVQASGSEFRVNLSRGKVKPGKSVTGEMPLEVLESQQSPRGFVLLALHEARMGEVEWRRERDALEEAAQRAVADQVRR